MRKITKYFWSAYYYFKPVNRNLGSSEYITMFARTHGLKITNLKLAKGSSLSYMGLVE